MGWLQDTLGLDVGDVVGAGAATAANVIGKNSLSNLAEDVDKQSSALQASIAGTAQFKPYSVSSAAGGMNYDAAGNTSYNLTNQGTVNSLNQQAAQAAQNIGGGIPTGLQGFANNSLQGASGALSQYQNIDPTMAAQRASLGGLFNQQFGDYGQLGQSLQGSAQDLLGSGQQYIQGAGQNQQMLGLSQQFGNAAAQYNPALQSQAGSRLSQQALGSVNLGERGQYVGNAFGNLSTPDALTGAGSMANQYMQAGSQALGQASPTAQSIYDQIRATQTPEEERNAVALENMLFAQGRGGVSTAAYGGTPEQLAQAKAQAEARNSASLQSITTADSLASSQQQRAAQLSQLGLTAEQAQSQANAQRYGQDLQAGQAGIQTAQAQSELDSQAQQRQMQLAQLGLSAEQIASQLQTEGLGRAAQSAQLSGQLAGVSSDLESAAINRGSGLFNLGLQGQQAGQGLDSQQLSDILKLQQQDIGSAQAQQALQTGSLGQAQSLFGMSGQAAALGGQLKGQDINNLTAIMNATGIPMEQLLAQMQPALTNAQLAQQGRNTQSGLMAQLGGQQITSATNLGLGMSTLDQELIRGLSNIASQTPT